MIDQAEPKSVVGRFLREVLAGSDPEADRALIANASLLRRVQAFRMSFADVEITPRVMVANEDLVAVAFSTRAIHRGTFQGVAPTGIRWTATSCGIYRVEAGRIADFWVTSDVLAILEQLGAIRRRSDLSA